MNSFIGWVGGKNRLKKQIIPLIPSNTERYIEVSGGAGWVLSGKEQKQGQMEIFNDIDRNLINLYRQKSIIVMIWRKKLIGFKAENYCKQIENNVPLTDLQCAARYLYLMKCSFGSMKTSFATASKGISGIIDKLPNYQKRLSKLVIENRDFGQLIKVYDRPKALFYLDPPYAQTEKYYDAYSFTNSNHHRLNSVLKSIKGRFILSYNDCDFIRELYKDYNIIPINRLNLLPANTENRTNFKEVIITNFDNNLQIMNIITSLIIIMDY